MTEEHIIIDSNRFITVPKALQRIAVQHDHNIETVTFDCPRYWDGHDMSEMNVYINYMRADSSIGMCLAQNITIDENDADIMHFDWIISRNAAKATGTLSFLVCIKKTDEFGYSLHHWNSELNQEMFVSEGLECEESILEAYPDVISHLLTRLDFIEGQSEAYVREHVDAYFAENPFGVDDTLKISGLAADAAVTGEKFDKLNEAINNVDIKSEALLGEAENRLNTHVDETRISLERADREHNESGDAHADIRRSIRSLTAYDVDAFSVDQTTGGVADLFGLMHDCTPAEIFSILGSYYWLCRKAATSYPPTVGEVITQTGDSFNYCVLSTKRRSGYSYDQTSQRIYYADRVMIDEIGRVRLVNPVILTTSYTGADLTTLASTLQGKYVHVVNMSNPNQYTNNSNLEVAYIPTDATFVKDSYSDDGYYDIYPSKIQMVTAEMPDRENWEVLSYINDTLYPKNTIRDGYEYVYLGRLIENFIAGGSKVYFGSYVGTGTVGYDGACKTDPLDFIPKVLWFPGEGVTMMLETHIVEGDTGYLTCGSYGTTAMWYVRPMTATNMGRASDQLNTKDQVYNYIAIG